MDIGPGDWVAHENGTVRQVIELRQPGPGWAGWRCDCGYVHGLALILTGTGDPKCPKHWRPIYRPKAEIIEALKQPAPELEPHHA